MLQDERTVFKALTMTYKFEIVLLIISEVVMEFMGLISPYMMKLLITYIKVTNNTN